MSDHDDRNRERPVAPREEVVPGDIARRELGLTAEELKAGRFRNGDPLPRNGDVSLQDPPQVTEMHVLAPNRDSADEDKAPPPVRVIAPQPKR